MADLTAPAPPSRRSLPPALTIALIYLAARAVTFGFLILAAALSAEGTRFGAGASVQDLVVGWDAQWYWFLAVNGYPADLPLTDAGAVAENQWAFMPIYAYLAAAIAPLVGGWWGVAAVLISLAAGYGATYVLYRMLRGRIGGSAAIWASAFFAAGPLAALFQVGYAEALFLLWLFLALWAVTARRFVWVYPLVVLMGYTRPGVLAFALFIGLPFLLEWRGVETLGVPAAGWLLGWIVAFTAVVSAARASGAVQRNFAQGALGKYLPREMAQEILDNPQLLALHGEKKELFVLFSDLEGFTKMSHAIPPEMVAKLLNRYLEMLSEVILEHGGILDKFIGDAVVAFWGAPISRPDDGERAARAGYAIWQAGEQFRKEVAEMDPGLPKIGKTRVGLHVGEAVVGNFGGENRIQYTALGDSMNTAARLESGNKAFGSTIMASAEFARRSGLDWWRPMGSVVLSGRASALELAEPAPDFPADDRRALAEAVALLQTDRAKGIESLEKIAARYPDDTALQALLARSRELNEDGAYVMGSK